MKYLLVTILLMAAPYAHAQSMFFPGPGASVAASFTPPAVVNYTGLAPANGSGGGTTPAISTTGATMLSCAVYAQQQSATTCTVSDSLGNTWSHLNNYGNNSYYRDRKSVV